MEKIIFLDRDGVINEFPGRGEYVTRWEDFHLLPSAKKAIALLTASGFEMNVISNQGCVSGGLLTLQELETITSKMLKGVESAGGRIHGVFYCIHKTADRCKCKKPQTALFHQAARGRDIDFSNAYFVGDSEEDMQAGENIGCRTVLVLSGRAQEEDLSRFLVKPQIVKKDLLDAAQWILEVKKKS